MAAIAARTGFGENLFERRIEQACNQLTVSKCHVILSKSGS